MFDPSQPVTAADALPIGGQIGKRAADFVMYNKQGVSVNLRDLEGQLVFLNFGGHWCKPWRITIDDMLNVVDQYDDRITFVFLGFNTFYHDGLPLDPSEHNAGPAPLMEKYFADLANRELHSDADVNAAALAYFGENTLYDFRGVGQRQYRSYTDQIYGIPATFLINRAGEVVFEAHNIYQYWEPNKDVLDAFIAGEDLEMYLDRFPVEDIVRLD